MRATCLTNLILLDLITLITAGEEQNHESPRCMIFFTIVSLSFP
jgi:hypothetical protein